MDRALPLPRRRTWVLLLVLVVVWAPLAARASCDCGGPPVEAEDRACCREAPPGSACCCGDRGATEGGLAPGGCSRTCGAVTTAVALDGRSAGDLLPDAWASLPVERLAGEPLVNRRRARGLLTLRPPPERPPLYLLDSALLL